MKVKDLFKRKEKENRDWRYWMEETVRLRKDLYENSFTISDDEFGKIEKWKLEHEENSCPYGDYPMDHNYEYVFIPTFSGIIGMVRCKCGLSYMFRDIDRKHNL